MVNVAFSALYMTPELMSLAFCAVIVPKFLTVICACPKFMSAAVVKVAFLSLYRLEPVLNDIFPLTLKVPKFFTEIFVWV